MNKKYKFIVCYLEFKKYIHNTSEADPTVYSVPYTFSTACFAAFAATICEIKQNMKRIRTF